MRPLLQVKLNQLSVTDCAILGFLYIFFVCLFMPLLPVAVKLPYFPISESKCIAREMGWLDDDMNFDYEVESQEGVTSDILKRITIR